MKKNILFACVEKNIGDDLFIFLICNRYKNIDFIITHKARYGTLAQIKNLHFSILLAAWEKASNNYNNKIKRCLANIAEHLLSIMMGKPDLAIYIVGNAFKNMRYEGKHQSDWLKKRVNLTKEFYLISTNFGPFEDYRWKKDLEEIFSKMSKVYFRDKPSYELFKNNPNISYAPDATISLKKLLSLPLNTKVSNGNNTKNIIISVIDCGLYSRSEKIRLIKNEYEKKMVEIINYFVNKEYQIKILNSNTEQDLPASKRIQKNFNNRNVEVVSYDGNLEKIFELYKNCDFVIGTRLHTVILSWIYDVPVFPVVYDIKLKGVIESYKFEEKWVDIQNIGTVEPKELEDIIHKYRYRIPKSIEAECENQFYEIDKHFSKDDKS